MPKLRVYNLARELNLDNAEVIRELQHMGVPVTSHSNTVDNRQAEQLRKKFGPASAEALKAAAPVESKVEAPPEAAEVKISKPAKTEPVVEAPRIETKPE